MPIKSAKRLFGNAKKGVKKRGSHQPIEKCREENAGFLVKMLAFRGGHGYNKNTGCGKQIISAQKSYRVVYSFADTARTPHGDENGDCLADHLYAGRHSPYPSRGRKRSAGKFLRQLQRHSPYPSRGRKLWSVDPSEPAVWTQPVPLTGTKNHLPHGIRSCAAGGFCFVGGAILPEKPRRKRVSECFSVTNRKAWMPGDWFRVFSRRFSCFAAVPAVTGLQI